MSEERIQVTVPMIDDALHGREDLELGATFEIPVRSKMRGMAIGGLVVFTVGFLVLAVLAGFFIAGYPEDWYPEEDAGGNVINQDETQTLQERVGVLGLIGVPLLFLGLSMYTYGRTYRGDEELELPAHPEGHA